MIDMPDDGETLTKEHFKAMKNMFDNPSPDVANRFIPLPNWQLKMLIEEGLIDEKWSRYVVGVGEVDSQEIR